MPICPVEFKTKSQFRQIDIQFFPAEYGFVVIYYICLPEPQFDTGLQNVHTVVL